MFVKLFAALSFGMFGLQFQIPSHSQLDNFNGTPPVQVKRHDVGGPTGLTPAKMKKAYGLTTAGAGSGTIAIVDAYDDPNAASDLNTFSANESLPTCNSANPCFEKHKMAPRVRSDSGWALEESLDIEWAHAIAPGAKILLVEAKTASGTDLLNAVNYARNRSDVVAVSMSWGGSEFSSETSYDSYFTSGHGVNFFASSGDNGNGVSWPAVSPNVIGVGGTTLNIDSSGNYLGETAWSGSGGGTSLYEQATMDQVLSGAAPFGLRNVPDVAYDADPNTGVAVYDSTPYYGLSGWWNVGGTSAGSPQWAAISTLGTGFKSSQLYSDYTGSSYSSLFHDITSGNNGSCGSACDASTGYDLVTGLGSPKTYQF